MGEFSTNKRAVQSGENRTGVGAGPEHHSPNRAAYGPFGPGPLSSQPRAILSQMEGAFGTDFSGVQLKLNSASAGRLGALAYTQGDTIHFAPGQFRPESESGRELLGHELAHVIQQRQGRVAPTGLVKGTPVNSNAALEQEAQTQGRAAARGEAVSLAGGARNATAGDGVIQGVFAVQAIIEEPEDSAETVPLDELAVGELKVPEKKRPHTRFGAQKAHTLNWTMKVAEWKAKLQNKPYRTVLAELWQMANSDQMVDSEEDGQQLRSRVLVTAEMLSQETEKYPVSYWLSMLSQLITTYIRAYQKASFAAYANKASRGKGEGKKKANILAVEEKLANGLYVSPEEGEQALKDAKDMVDIYGGRLSEDEIEYLMGGWERMFQTLTPNLFAHFQKGDEQADAQSVKDWYLSRYSYDVTGADIVVSPDAEVGQSEEEAEALDPTDQVSDPATGFLVDVQLIGGQKRYAAKELSVTRLEVSDERPKTQAGNRQWSHTIPWSLKRRVWPALFTGELDKVLELLRDRSGEDLDWTGTPGAKIAPSLMTDVAALLGGPKRTVAEWTHLLNRLIEQYAEEYQRSASATFPPVDRSNSKGEGAALRALGDWEANDGHVIEHHIRRHGSARNSVVYYASRLIDLPGTARAEVQLDNDGIKRRWLSDLATVFPKVLGNYKAAFESAFETVSFTGKSVDSGKTKAAKSHKRTREDDRSSDETEDESIDVPVITTEESSEPQMKRRREAIPQSPPIVTTSNGWNTSGPPTSNDNSQPKPRRRRKTKKRESPGDNKEG